ncbi:MAG TPA: phosphoribosylglycinamide formyltransferase, partial [Lachnospiraceae bacterium]|nr:phosphoribosylglycinamide formyltransferase [Lachnospiraceae bacterium]
EGDTPESLQRRVMEEAEWILLPEAVRLISEDKVTIENNIVRIKK